MFPITIRRVVPLGDEKKEENVRRTLEVIRALNRLPVPLNNEIIFGTPWTEILLDLNARGIQNQTILNLTKKYLVVWPWSAEYDRARLSSNKEFVKFPILVAFPRNRKEVKGFINFANVAGFKITIRSGGHCFAGFCVEGGVVIDTTFLLLPKCIRDNYKVLTGGDGVIGTIALDKEHNILHISPGVRLGTLYEALAKEHLGIAGGACPPVAIGGLALNGGVGYFIRKFGYTTDNVKELDIGIVSDGGSAKVITATQDNEFSDLFQASKGAGGGNFGICTRLAIKVFPLDKVVFFTYTFAITDLPSVLQAWQNLVQVAPDDLSGTAVNIGGGLPVFSLDGIFIASYEAMKRFKKLFTKEFLSLLPPDVQPITTQVDLLPFTEAERQIALTIALIPIIFPFYKFKSNFSFKPLSEDDLQAFTNSLQDSPPEGTVTAYQFLSMGGAVNRVPINKSVMPAREGAISWFSGGVLWPNQNQEEEATSFFEKQYGTISPFLSPIAYPAYPDLDLPDPLLSYYDGYVPFLEQIKLKYDPTDLFHFSQGVPLPS